MTNVEKIQKFAAMLSAPNGTAWARIIPVNKSKTWKGGSTCEWLSYDVQMIYVTNGQLREIEWNYYRGKISTFPIVFNTDDIDYICEFTQTNREGIFDAFDKFFYDSREARTSSPEECEKARLEWREYHEGCLPFVNE